MQTVWRPIPGFEGVYEASSSGNIRRTGKVAGAVVGRILKESTSKTGYRRVGLWSNGKCALTYVHRAVASAFHGPSDLAVNHINGNKSDNRPENLEYVTAKENMRHASDVLRANNGESAHLAKLSASDVRTIRRLHGHEQMSAYVISKIYPVAHSTIHRIVTMRTWKHLD
jgi:hypothetical protein